MERHLANQIRRTSNARHFAKNTCPASRHVHLMALSLAKGDKYHMVDEEPQHVALSLLSVLESLWKLRTETGWPSKKEAAKMGRAIRKLMAESSPLSAAEDGRG